MTGKAAGIKKRILSVGLAAVLFASQCDFTVFGASSAVHIRDEGEFLLLAEQCRAESFSTGKTFYLEKDLDLSEQENLFLPVMDGVFEGNGHQITGVSLKEEMSDYGLFRYVGTNGEIRNLTVEGEVASGGEQENTGIIVGSNAGKIENCISRGTLNGQTSAGGIAGKNEETGSILRSRNEAQIDGRTGTGGIAGSNEGAIEDCSNAGNINTNRKALKEMDGEGSVTISIPNAVTGLGADERANQTGGIAGRSTGSISYCKNEGTVGCRHLGYETGGIAGRQSGSISYSSNEGTVYGRKDVGGIVGYFEPYEASSYDRDISQELEDQLDELSDLIDGLGDAGDRLGDHLSDNLDLLSDQMKGLRDSLRGYLDDFENMADESRDAIESQIDHVRETLDDVQFDFDLEKLSEHIRAIEMDMQQIQDVLEQLQPILETAGGEMKAELEKTIDDYSKQLEELERVLELLKKYIEGQAGRTALEAESADPSELSDLFEEIQDTEEKEDSEEPGDGETQGSPEEGEEPAVDILEREHMEESEEPTVDVLEGEHTERELQEEEGQAGAENGNPANPGRMEPMAFSTVKISDEQAVELAAGMELLRQLSNDIVIRMNEIALILGVLPGDAEGLRDSVKTIGSQINDLTDTMSRELDDWGDELGDMKDELKGRGDGISDSLEATGDALDSDWDAVSDQLSRIKDHFRDIRATVSDGFDELRDRIEDRSVYVDISDLATRDTGDGKVVSCSNEGEIYSDSQAGGIAGSIDKEGTSNVTDWIFDRDEKEDEEEESKDSITKHVLAAIIHCKNTSDISAVNSYAGGIVGKAEYGAVISCENYGDIVSEDGGYVGGIAGMSAHGIRDSYVLCGLDGTSYVGGVAGDGEDISGSYVCSYMDMEDHVKSSGAIAGKAGGTVADNYFVDNGYGAVDGVTRSQEALSMDYAALIAMKELPENFTTFTIRFLDGENVVWQENFSYGDELPKESYPALTETKSEYVYWEDKNISPVHRNVTVHAIRRAYIPSLVSGDSEGHPAVLMGGEFYPDTALAVREASEEELTKIKESMGSMDMLPAYHIKQVYYYQITQEEPLRSQVTLRVADNSYLADSLMTLDSGFSVVGEAQKTENVGSFLSADTVIAENGYVVVMDRIDTWVTILGAAGVIILTILILLAIHRWKQKHKADAETEEETKGEKKEEEGA